MLIPDGYTQLNFRFTGAALPTGAEVVFGVENLAELAPADVAGDVFAAFSTADVMNSLTTDVSLTSILAKNGPNETGPSAEVAVGLPGEQALASCPPNVAALVKKATAVGGRRGQGRMYFPGWPEASVENNGTMHAGSRTTFQGKLDTFLDELVTAGNRMVLLHAELPTPPAPYVVTDLLVSDRVATQRRRLRR